jgi:hypothetical protein
MFLYLSVLIELKFSASLFLLEFHLQAEQRLAQNLIVVELIQEPQSVLEQTELKKKLVFLFKKRRISTIFKQ